MESSIHQKQGFLSAEQLDIYRSDGYIVLPHFLHDDDIAPAREAMQQKVDSIAKDLYKDGLITDLYLNEPFETRLAKLFENLTDQDFLRYGRSWRDRLPGYFRLMSNPKILDVVESILGSEIY